MGLRTMLLNLIRPHRPPPCDGCPWVPSPEIQARAEAGDEEVVKASNAHSRAVFGVVAAAGQAMAAESRVQAMMRGVLKEVDRDGGH